MGTDVTARGLDIHGVEGGAWVAPGRVCEWGAGTAEACVHPPAGIRQLAPTNSAQHTSLPGRCQQQLNTLSQFPIPNHAHSGGHQLLLPADHRGLRAPHRPHRAGRQDGPRPHFLCGRQRQAAGWRADQRAAGGQAGLSLPLSSSFFFSLVFTSVSVHAVSMDVLRGASQAGVVL